MTDAFDDDKYNTDEELYISGRSESTCEWCGGQMTWCECCQVYSHNCCVDYGTCECS